MKNISIREKLIIENELKFKIMNKNDFKYIYEYLNNNYDLIPYKTAQMYDKYFDTPNYDLLKNNIAFRIRNRPQISINIKLPPTKTGAIWSRYEYSSKVDNKIANPLDILNLNCDACNTMRSYLGDKYNSLINILTIKSFRIGFNVYFKEKNILGNKELLGVAFFDTSLNTEKEVEFLEFELESYEQTDVFASPYIFQHFNKIATQLEIKGYQPSESSKLSRIFKEKE